jgi:imidazolonepropionase-like amidohydrolase
VSKLLITNARVFDGSSADCAEGMNVVVADGLVQELSTRPIATNGARTIDAAGRTLLPGLIDAHFHAYASDVSVAKIEASGHAYRTAHAVVALGHALDYGFTTVRDVGGGDRSLARAIADGLVRAPRFFYSGRALSMTGGHGDFRPLESSAPEHCACADMSSLCALADGVDACLKATREELRRGAHCIKIMGSGGVASPADPIWMNQYREDEIRAIVGEAAARRSYVTAHCHPASAVRRCVEFGVRSIEHGTLIDDETAEFVAARGAYVVPTMATIFSLKEAGKRLGFPPESQEKMEVAYAAALEGMDRMRRAGVKLGFGTDLLGSLHVQECREFTIRSEVFSPLEILRQATSINAELMQLEGKLGCVAPGAYADLLVVDGDPLADAGVLAADGKSLRVVVRAGEVVKDDRG